MEAKFRKYTLQFKRPGGTSRGVLTQKETYFIIISQENSIGIGECGILRGLSVDDRPDYEEKLKWVCEHIEKPLPHLRRFLNAYPSIQFGLEQALISLGSNRPFELFHSPFIRNESPIPINGLVWMGDHGFMRSQIEEKLAQGFRCIKMKVGAIDFEKEMELLRWIRTKFPKEKIELRVDANGAFGADDALDKLEELSEMDLHSIEQPIKPGQWGVMKTLCSTSPIPIALDEELIGVFTWERKKELLETIKPQYLILKPSLIGGFKGSEEWIALANEFNIGWWVTSALESNIGLNAIAQWTFTLNSNMPQGLGTGSLFVNNFESPLQVADGQLFYRNKLSWSANLINSLCS